MSKYSVKKDTKTLPEQYHRARVPEYWLIDARGEKVDFTILIWRQSGYEPTKVKRDWQYSNAFAGWFR